MADHQQWSNAFLKAARDAAPRYLQGHCHQSICWFHDSPFPWRMSQEYQSHILQSSNSLLENRTVGIGNPCEPSANLLLLKATYTCENSSIATFFSIYLVCRPLVLSASQDLSSLIEWTKTTRVPMIASESFASSTISFLPWVYHLQRSN